MKLLLLVATIHLLILHQYRKDRSEALAPKTDAESKTALPEKTPDYLFRGLTLSHADSLQFSYHVSPGPFYFLTHYPQ